MSSSTLATPVPLARDAATIGWVSVAHGQSHFCQLIVPPLFPWLAADFSLSYTQLGLLMTVFFVVSCGGQAAAGFVVDRYGARGVLFGGLGLLAAAAAGLATAPSYAVMLLWMAVAGIGNSVFHPVDFSILNARVSTPRLGHAYAAHGISGNVGWALAPVFVAGIAHLASWRVALGAVALLVLAVLALLVMVRESLAMPDDRAASRAAAGRGGAAAAADAGPFGFLKLPAVWACFAFFLIYAFALGGINTFAPQAAGKLHAVPAAQVAICLSVFMTCAALGMVLGGHLVKDPTRSARIVAVGFCASAGVALAIGLLPWPPVAVPVLFGLMGFGAGIAGPSRDLLVKQATPPGATGRVYGVVYSGLDVGMALAPLLFGALLDRGLATGVWVGVAVAQLLLVASAFNVRRRWRPAATAAVA